MSVREIAERHVREWRLNDEFEFEDMVERAIREAAKPLVEALEQIEGRGAVGAWEVEGALDGCVSIAEEALAAWKEGQ